MCGGGYQSARQEGKVTEKSARFIRGLLRWAFVLFLTAVGTYVAVRLPLFEAYNIPEGLRLVLSVEVVGLAVVSTSEIATRWTGLGQVVDKMIWRILVAGAEPHRGTATARG